MKTQKFRVGDWVEVLPLGKKNRAFKVDEVDPDNGYIVKLIHGDDTEVPNGYIVGLSDDQLCPLHDYQVELCVDGNFTKSLGEVCAPTDRRALEAAFDLLREEAEDLSFDHPELLELKLTLKLKMKAEHINLEMKI